MWQQTNTANNPTSNDDEIFTLSFMFGCYVSTLFNNQTIHFQNGDASLVCLKGAGYRRTPHEYHRILQEHRRMPHDTAGVLQDPQDIEQWISCIPVSCSFQTYCTPLCHGSDSSLPVMWTVRHTGPTKCHTSRTDWETANPSPNPRSVRYFVIPNSNL